MLKKQNKKRLTKVVLSNLAMLATAFLSGVSFYFTSAIQASDKINYKQYEYRVDAYQRFIFSMNVHKSPTMAKLLTIGKLSEHVATDSEIQSLQDAFYELSNMNSDSTLYWELDSHFNVIRLYGSKKVKQYCEDILTVLARDRQIINWDKYPLDVRLSKEKWSSLILEGGPYGYEEMVDENEQLMFVLLSMLYKNLIEQLSHEINFKEGSWRRLG